MRLLSLLLSLAIVAAKADIPIIEKSESPDGRFYAVMDIDRDPKIHPEWKGDSYPKIEITEKATRKVFVSIEYSGSPGDDLSPLREHVSVVWRQDSQAFAVNVDDRFYTSCNVYVFGKDAKFVSVPIPDYQTMTGFPEPDVDHLRAIGRTSVRDWDQKGRLIYNIFFSPLVTFTGNDPLVHRVYLRVTETGMIPEEVENEKGIWQRGDWIVEEKTVPDAPEAHPEPDAR